MKSNNKNMNKNVTLLLLAFSILCLSFVTADTEDLFPTANGFTNTLTNVGCTNSYECVDENPPDDDTTYLHTTAIQTYQYDLFELQNHTGGQFDTINSVTVKYRVRCENAGGSVCKFKSYLRTESTNYEGAEKLSSGVTYINYTEVYNTNPNTGTAWTIQQVNDLQAGFGLNGFLNSEGNRARGTQVFVQVDYTPAAEPVITFVDPTPANDTFINVNYTYINVTTDISSDVVYLEWNGTNLTMSGSGTNFYLNVTDLLNCSDYTYKVYANSTASGLWGVSETRIVKTSLYDPAINWNTPSTDGLTYYDDFYINATVLNCNITDINITIYDIDDNAFYFKQITSVHQPSYNIYELTNFTDNQEPIKINKIEICAVNEGGLRGCSNRTFIYDSQYSSPQHSSITLDDFTFSSSTYITILNETFNQSVINNATFRSSFYTEKIDVPGQNNDIYMKYIFNGIELCDKKVVTLTSLNSYRSVVSCISEYETIIGENNVVIQIRRTNSGNINIYDWDFHYENGETNLNSDFRRDLNLQDSNITSSTYEAVINFTTEKRTNSTTTIDFSMSITPQIPSTVECYITNGVEIGQTLIRSTNVNSETMSVGGVFTTSIPQTTSENWLLYCKQDVSTSTINFEAYTQDNKDDDNRTMYFEYQRNLSINSTNPLTLTAGKHKLGEIINYEIKSGDSVDFIISVIAESLTTTNLLNISLEAINHLKSYETSHLRTLDQIGSEASIKFYGEFDNLSVGDLINITLYANVATGESVNIKSESINARDTKEMDVTTSNLPPLVKIDYPVNGQTVWYNNQPFNITVVDFNNNLDTCNVTLNDTILSQGFTSNTFVNYTSFLYGDYIMKLSCNDTFSAFGQYNISVTLACTENWQEQISVCGTNNLQTITYTDLNSCGTNLTLPSNNGSNIGCTYLSINFTDLFTFDDLILGKYYSYKGKIFDRNTTFPITNAKCSFNMEVDINSTDSLLISHDDYYSEANGILPFLKDTNEWKSENNKDLLLKNGILNIECICRPDCTDTSELGCCILANGSLITQFKYGNHQFNYTITKDKTFDQEKEKNAVIALGFFVLMIAFTIFILDKKHNLFRYILLSTFIPLGFLIVIRTNIITNYGLPVTTLLVALVFAIAGYFIYYISNIMLPKYKENKRNKLRR